MLGNTEFCNKNGFHFVRTPEAKRLSRYRCEDRAVMLQQADEVLTLAINSCDSTGMMRLNTQKVKNVEFAERYNLNHQRVLNQIKWGLLFHKKGVKLLKVTRNYYRDDNGNVVFPGLSDTEDAHLCFAFEISDARKLGLPFNGNIFVRICEAPDTKEPWLDSFHTSQNEDGSFMNSVQKKEAHEYVRMDHDQREQGVSLMEQIENSRKEKESDDH